MLRLVGGLQAVGQALCVSLPPPPCVLIRRQTSFALCTPI